jgi:hypothetical protein
MKKRKPETGTAEYAPDKVMPAPQPKKKTGTTNRLREMCSQKRESISSSVALQNRGKMTRLPAKLQPGATTWPTTTTSTKSPSKPSSQNMAQNEPSPELEAIRKTNRSKKGRKEKRTTKKAMKPRDCIEPRDH